MAKVVIFKVKIREASMKDYEGEHRVAVDFVNPPPEYSDMRAQLYSIIREMVEATANKAGVDLSDITVLRFEGEGKKIVLPA